MSDIALIHTDTAPAAVGPYSQATRTGNMLFVSGQLGIIPGQGKLAEGFKAQTRQALDNLKAILEAAGSSLDRVLAVDVFVMDMARFADLNAIYSEYFGNHKPARAAIQVAGLPLGGLVELKCIALAL
ncbi:MAG: RidA family protein [Pseudodesulfovibrio sp.]|uniref:Endoribonuclease L-PSP n=1 Tax=Pseudodesulfovibrio aespoeensis (strain ATCC 700646 / DSM 10631 / Aspo-2) TaxID=643562 RepID=E6VRK8_PSEA9|nr:MULTISPECIES: RidA family protein [Pseudodesulfovibrio]MBU4377912.1 RidA family protein [Pseudomonadota bacterium]ADU63045.1 endoribonuclease L-PSP [Pseudodesulfovibrio aespoeensis Aspo-2]MBU4475850.1 RidA family protein [Pseudomonadota bacterium]MBU4516688.1 RidA family protein [Pseudomonadota bacterium]MBU4522645.1 RidA family protein [Pseudomonadota bacterium]